jgi:DNA adenine methylase
MRYMGGKFRQSKAIVAELVRRYNGEKIYWEPFCGAMGVAEKAVPELMKLGVEEVVLSDVSEPLVNMWKEAVGGWIPPIFVSRKRYEEVKAKDNAGDPMTAYCGFGLSFGGKWWGGYGKKQTKEGQRATRKAIVRKAKVLAGCKIVWSSYEYLKVGQGLVYLDPPYEGTTKAHNFEEFCHKRFWRWARKLSEKNNVIATSFKARKGWKTLYSWGDTVSYVKGIRVGDAVNERIFEWGGKKKSLGDVVNGAVAKQKRVKSRPSILLCRNIPRPMHGVAPREVLGAKWWKETKEEAKKRCGGRCEACGVHKDVAKARKWLEGHEIYEIDYERGRMKYVETVMLCHYCHCFIHIRLLGTMIANGKSPRRKMDEVVEHGEGILLAAGLEKEEEDPGLERLVEWEDWRMVVDGKKYPPKYANRRQWYAMHRRRK